MLQLLLIESRPSWATEDADTQKVKTNQPKLNSRINELSKLVKAPPEQKALAEASIQLMDLYVERDDFDSATKVRELAWAAARKSRDTDLIRLVREMTDRVNSLAQQFQEVEASFATLETDPTDPKANELAGRYRCFAKGQWSDGLPMLALSGDEEIKSLAIRELKMPTTSNEQALLGDGWYDLAQDSKGLDRQRMMERAELWYQRSLKSEPALLSLLKARVVKRQDELKTLLGHKVSAIKPIDLLRQVNIERDVAAGQWKLISGSLVCPTRNQGNGINLPCELPAQYDLHLTVERQPGQRSKPIHYDLILDLAWQNRRFLVVIEGWGANGEVPSTGLHKLDGKEALSNETTFKGSVLTDGKPCDVICKVRSNRVTVLCEGKPVIDWTGDCQRLGEPVSEGTKPQLAVATRVSTRISRITLLPVAENSEKD